LKASTPLTLFITWKRSSAAPLPEARPDWQDFQSRKSFLSFLQRNSFSARLKRLRLVRESLFALSEKTTGNQCREWFTSDRIFLFCICSEEKFKMFVVLRADFERRKDFFRLLSGEG
jgi:hypothetical protein